MFSNAKIAIGGGLIVLILIAAFTYWSRGKEIVKLKDTVVLQKVANKVLDKTVKDNMIVATTTSSANKKLTEAVDTITKNRIQVIYKVQTQLVELDRVGKLDTTLKTQEWHDANDRKNSKILIDGLWEQFCFNTPKYPTCIK